MSGSSSAGGAGELLESSINQPVDSWLAELHMECYKKNLENFDTLKVSGEHT